MRIAIVGAAGQLGTALQACLRGEIVPLAHAEIEITDPQRVAAALAAARPDCVINCAAYNFVDRAEDEPDAAFAVNAEGPRNLARWCARPTPCSFTSVRIMSSVRTSIASCPIPKPACPVRKACMRRANWRASNSCGPI